MANPLTVEEFDRLRDQARQYTASDEILVKLLNKRFSGGNAELESENVRLKQLVKRHEDNAVHLHNRVAAYQDDINKLKAERRELAYRVGRAVHDLRAPSFLEEVDAIVEQELNK